jgi:hypothetical protein
MILHSIAAALLDAVVMVTTAQGEGKNPELW